MAEPALELTIRQKEGLGGFIGQDCVVDDRALIAGQDVKSFQYNASGSLLAVVKVDSVSVYNTQTKTEKISFAVASVAAVSFSPQNSYLTMFESFRSNFSASSAPAAEAAAAPAAEAGEEGESSSSSSSSSAAPSSSPAKEVHQNLSVWDLETGEKIYARTQKIFIRDQWPSIRWTHDECVGAMIVTTGVQFFSGKRFTTITRNLKKPNIKLFSWAPNSSSSNYLFSIFIMAAKSSPSSVGLYSYPNVDRAICFKSTFNADSADLKWNATGTALLAHTRSDVDRTGKSYYGETNLLYLNSAGDSQFVVDTPPIFDAGWSPSGDKFFAVYGTLPAHTRIFTSKCEKFADFPVNHYNSGYFSPNGKMIILAGFGNLQGQVDIWDVQNAKLISSQVIPCTTYLSWSPCSRFFFTATLSPRLRVDNGFKIWTPTGALVKTVLFPELYQVDWKPINASAFAEYIPSPAEYCAPPKAAEGSSEPPKPKPGAYVPPHLRGQAAAAPAPVKETPKQGTRFTEEMLLRESLPVGAMEKKKKKSEATTQLPAHFSSPAPSAPYGNSSSCL